MYSPVTSLTLFLTFAFSALAYQVTSPSNATGGWTTTGPNVVTWQRVATDAQNFTIVLVNQKAFPPYQQSLNALVDGVNQSNLTVNPPSGGWVAGDGYRVNLVKSAQETDTILAQSGEFSIRAGTGTSTFSRASGTLVVPPTRTPSSTTDDLSPTTPPESDPINNSAPSRFNVQVGLITFLAILGSFLV